MNETPLDVDVVNLMAELGPPSTASAVGVPANDLRQGARANVAVFTRDCALIEVPHVVDDVVAGSGGQIPVRTYSPDVPLAVIVYLHGGAWVTGDIETHDMVTRRLSRDTGALVVSVDYRMLPEHPFPAPFNDAYDAIVWAKDLRPDLPFLIAGDSAGGTLAACAALRARDENGPQIDAQVLVYPGIDDNMDWPSVTAFSEGPGVTRENLEFFVRQYASNEAGTGSSYALPGRATSLAGLPPALVAIAGHDILRSSEEDYARRLHDAGVSVTVQLDAELMHSWIDFAPRVPAADRAFSRLTDSINELIVQVTQSTVVSPSCRTVA